MPSLQKARWIWWRLTKVRDSASDFFCSHPQSSLDGRSVSLTPLFPLREDRTARSNIVEHWGFFVLPPFKLLGVSFFPSKKSKAKTH